MDAIGDLRLPDDYRWFLSRYGGGEIGRSTVVVVPDELKVTEGEGQMGQETGTAHLTWELEGGIPGIDDVPPPILSWGVDDAPTLLCWLTIDDDPNEWPVVTFSANVLRWEIHRCGMVEFLIRVISGEGPENPLPGNELWGMNLPRFLNRHEARRLVESGIDPDSGEPLNFS
ncbi:SMI1/KNR4 family protein [Embleya sp. MST-111070]|uniref:SMI1/KNR4 family protein n=1 Tax=Embleya sp. MST-111070 TaxID=3398231 RepID=UPI003F736C8E